MAVANNLSFTKAANELFITQSAVSQAISKLESQLNETLFVRERKNIYLTEKGKILKDHLSNGEKFFSSAYDHIKLESNKKKIGIACPDIYFSCFVLPYLKKYSAKHPKATYNVFGKSDYLLRISTIENNQNDFAIVEESEKNISSNIISKQFGTLNYRIIYNPEKFNLNNNMSIKDIFDNNHFLTQTLGTMPRIYLDTVLDQNFPKQFSEFYHVDALIDAVEAGIGIGFAPIEFLKNRNVNYLDVLQKKVDVYLIYKRHNENFIKDIFEI